MKNPYRNGQGCGKNFRKFQDLCNSGDGGGRQAKWATGSGSMASAFGTTSQENGIVPALLEEMGVGTAPVQLALQRELKNLPKIAGDEYRFS